MKKIVNKLNKKGFTLAELLIVVAIIAVLVAIMVPTFTGQVKKAQEAAAKANLRAAYAEAVVTYLDKGTAEQTISIPKAETDATVTYADLGVTGKDGSVELKKDNTKITVKFNPNGTVDSITCS